MEAPEFFMGSYQNGGPTDCLSSEKRSSYQNPSGFTVDDLLDLPNDDDTTVPNDGFFDNATNYHTDHSSTFNSTTDSCNSSASGNPVGYQSFADSHFSSELFVPYDDVAELEWLSNFVEDSFSFSTQHNLQSSFHFLSGSKQPAPGSFSYSQPTTRNPNNPIFQSETPPGKARSKRSRAVPCDWSTHLLHLSPAAKASRKKQGKPDPDPGADVVIRKCLHCAAEKTPQWRTGPMGPKTLCNACGVRYKSGRLVPEYRPATSPTFVSTKHSNSHRKVLELRRQKEVQRSPQERFLSQRSIFGGASNGGDDLLLHHHRGGVHFKHMI